MLICGFLFLVFAPCLVAYLSGSFADPTGSSDVYLDKWHLPRRRGSVPAPLQAMLPEVPVAEDFEIRSFPKGLSQRRFLIRDTEAGVKLTIAEVRAAAVELVKLAGLAAAYELALVAAAAASAMKSVKDAFAIAAQEVLDAARHAQSWLAWGDAMTEDSSPPNFFEDHSLPAAPRRAVPAVPVWREATQAA